MKRLAQGLPSFYHFANWILRNGIFQVLLRVEVHGLANVPREGPLIVASNHISFLDPLLAGAYLPRQVAMMAKAELFKYPLIRHVVQHYGAFPIRRGEGDARAFKHSLKILKHGGALFLAPEGTRSDTMQLQRGKEGAALLAARTGTPIVPMGIAGQEKWLHALVRFRRARVQIRFGPPFALVSPSRRPGREMLSAMTDAIMYRLAEELPPQYRGVYATSPREETSYVQPFPEGNHEAPAATRVQNNREPL